ncbi:MAG TPA: TRAP transporter permease, partial [Rubrivivax sp.]|nr:TRAP transporter permease [Rubrivivax sp.]HRY90604.1 TRAP transporter permease [Rubrivivax sp.]
FTVYDFTVTFVGCVLGITLLAAALSRFFLVEMSRAEQGLCVLAALLLIAPGLAPTVAGAVLALPVLLRQLGAHRRMARPAAG